jgi:iron complex outermembrane receptor protein
MNFTLRGASSAAIAVGLAGGFFPAYAQSAQDTVQLSSLSGPQETTTTAAVAQTAAPPAPAGGGERIVVTGSLIAGTPEDAALPVEVFSAAELEDQGSPTALEFVKNLTISGPTTGEAYYFGGAALVGSVNINLRSLGPDKTLTLLNGRRVSQNTSNIPSAAIARVEILKDGAAVTYGADATGGVVNYITRTDFTGLEAKAQYKYIDGSDGDYGVSVLGGFGNGDTNFLWSAEWEHRSRLNTMERDWATTSFNYATNSSPWSTLSNLGGYLARGAPTTSTNTANGELGSPLSATVFSDFTQASCGAVGGQYINSYTCAYNYLPYYNLVENSDVYRVYGQVNTTVTDTVDFHADVSYGQVSTPEIYGSPSQPVTRGPARSAGLTYQFYVPRTNPYFAEFAQRSGLAATAVYPLVDRITPITYRALAHGGNPALGGDGTYGTPSEIDNQVWRVSAGLNGTIGEWAGPLSDVGFDFAVTYNQQTLYQTNPDMLGYRLQQAINGFGGPSCNAVDLDPLRFGTQNAAAAGRNGCQYWNPFASSFANQPMRGLANPTYVAGSENSAELTKWLFDDRADENTLQSLTVDLSVNGETPITLPGGNIAWAAGTQWRQLENREQAFSDFYNGNTPCDWPAGFTTGVNGVPTAQIPVSANAPNYTGCSEFEPGPFVFFGTNKPDYTDLQQFSYFGEVQIPVLDNLSFNLAARHEEFSGNLSTTVYKVSGKWSVFGPLSVRGSYGTNFQAPPLGLVPGEVVAVNRSYTIAGSNWRGGTNTTASSIKPETAKAANYGVIWQSGGFTSDSDFQVTLDYFDIQTEDEIGEVVTHSRLANTIFFVDNNADGRADVGADTLALANCSSPLIGRVTFNDTANSPGGTCLQGSTTADMFSSIDTVFGNGPGQKTRGIDIATSYSMPAGPGDLTLSVQGTRVLELETSSVVLDGVTFTGDDRLGNLNFATVASAAPEWRANAFINYSFGPHNIRLQENYVSAVLDERDGVQYGENGEDWLTTDIYYNLDLPSDMKFSVSLVNLFDRDPPPAAEELGYDPRLGSPLGRTIELGIKKTF